MSPKSKINFREFKFFETLNHFKNYFGAGLAGVLLNFFSLPIITSLLTPAEFGYFKVTLSYVGIFAVLLTFNTHTSVGRYYFEKDNDIKGFMGTSVLLAGIIVFITSLVLLIFRQWFTGLLALPLPLFYLLLPLVFVQIASIFFKQIYQSAGLSKQVALRQVAQAYLSFGLGVLLVMGFRLRGDLGMVWGHAAIAGVFFIYYIFALRPYFRFNFSSSHIHYITRYSIPLIPYVLSGVVLAQLDRVMINHYFGADSSGKYSFAYDIGMLLALFTDAMFQAWMPKFFDYMNREDFKSHDVDTAKMFRLFAWAAVFLILFATEMGMLLAKKDFHEALPLVPLVVVGYLFNALFYVYGRSISFFKKTWIISTVVCFAGLLNIGLNVWLMPIYGYTVAAITTAVSYISMFLLTAMANKYILRIHTTPVSVWITPMLIAAIAVVIFYSIIEIKIGFWAGILLKMGAFGILTFLIFLKDIKGLISKIKKA